MIDNEEHLWKYVVGVIAPPAIIYCLLNFGQQYRPATLWIAYAMSAELALCALVGFIGGLFWFYARSAMLWYLAGVALLLDIVAVVIHRFYLVDKFSDTETLLFVLLLYFAVGYAAWRAIKFAIARGYHVLLWVISELGAAWRGELR